MIVEHNDVDIAPLFAWSREFTVSWADKEIPVYMRLLGDASINRARVAALRASADLRRRLKDTDSDERLVYIKDMDDVETESLIAVIAVFSIKDLTDKAQKKLKIKIPKQPRSDAKTSAHEKYQEEIDSYPIRRQEELKSLLEKEVQQLKTDLEKLSKEVVYNKYINIMIDELCEQELLRIFKAQCAYLGSYKNVELTEKLFSSFDEFLDIEPNLKSQFIDEYSRLELNGEDLKKLHRVTQ